MKTTRKVNKALKKFDKLFDDLNKAVDIADKEVRKQEVKVEKAFQLYHKVVEIGYTIRDLVKRAVNSVAIAYLENAKVKSEKADAKIIEVKQSKERAERVAEKLGELLK